MFEAGQGFVSPHSPPVTRHLWRVSSRQWDHECQGSFYGLDASDPAYWRLKGGAIAA
jgi:hypothetical protein